MNRTGKFLVGLSLLYAAPPPAAAQPIPLGSPTLVNPEPNLDASFARIGAADNGSFRMVWQQYFAATEYDIRSRRLQSNGTFGSVSTLNVYTSGNELTPALAMNRSADWAAAWKSTDQEGTGTGVHIYARRTTADGALLSGELALDNPLTTADVAAVEVDVDDSDEMAAAWIDASHTVWFERSTPEGAEIDEFAVGVGYPTTPYVAVAALGENRSVVAWTDFDASAEGVVLRCVTNTGPAGPAVPVNASAIGSQYKPQLASAPDGRFAVVWYSSATPSKLQVRLFDRDCHPTSAEIAVDDSGTFPTSKARIAMAADGAFVVTWDILVDENQIFAREFTKSGMPVGSAFSVLGAAFGSPVIPDVAVGPQTFAVAWSAPDYGLDGSLDVLVRRFARRVVFTDDFESADTTAWSSAAP